ncbi:MAG: hypothetical protein JWM78_1568 [Verrucomicrobiaceae bacterium]|nr:hypothetical protein [Verrucomicrobiaceae bacterium]
MKLPRLSLYTAVIAAMTTFVSTETFACASCGCTLSTEWDNLSFTGATGFTVDLRYDYLNQNQLRSGTNTISSTAASQRLNRGDAQEVEDYTKNDYLTLGLNYAINGDWGVNVQIPYINRSHGTLGTASDGVTPGDDGGQYKSDTSDLGDIKLVGRYQGFSEQHNFGILFGLKLATGSHTKYGTSTDLTAPEPVLIDRGLQPGTGTTDGILGAYYTDSINKDWDYFAQGLFQKALNAKDQYKPGDAINVNLGVRYQEFASFTPQLQLNARHVERDSGANADVFSTGGTLIYLSPGVSVPLTKKASIYSFVQLPVYQDVNGVQLAPRYTASIGARFSF